MARSISHVGWRIDRTDPNSSSGTDPEVLEVVVDGLKNTNKATIGTPVLRISNDGGTSPGLTVVRDGLAVAAGGIQVAAGRITETLTVVDDDSQNMTLAAADILAGINVHTTVTGGGTVTVDTAVNIIAGVPLTADDQCVVSYYVNDGNQTATFAVASGTTIADVGNTVLINEAAILLWRRTSSSAVVLYIVTS